MRGPIDFLIVGFEGGQFDGSVMEALTDAVQEGVIDLLDLSIISKDADGEVTLVDVVEADNHYGISVTRPSGGEQMIDDEDVGEVAGLLKDNTTAGLLVIEHLWAKPLKKALVDAGGVLVADGRIHPAAAMTLNV
jgi:hypothetical protein